MHKDNRNRFRKILSKTFGFWAAFLPSLRVPEKPENLKTFLVAGFPRSGTSLLCQILEKTGVYFGQKEDLRCADKKNPAGYYENRIITNISQQLISQSADIELSFQAKSLFAAFRRIFTRKQMFHLIKEFNSRGQDWGFKIKPAFIPRFTFHFWIPYVPEFKLILVYRHPLAAGSSYVKFKRDEISFSEVLSRWITYHHRILYYVGRYGGLIVRYEDLIDTKSRARVLKGITDFTGKSSVVDLNQIVRSDFDHHDDEEARLKRCYPLPIEVERILAVLDRFKI